GLQLAIRPLYESFLHAGINQSHHSAAEHEAVTNLQALNESFFDGTETPPLEQHIDESLGDDRSNVDQKFARHSRMSQRDHVVIADRNLPEDAAVLPCQGFTTALQIIQNAIEFLAGKIVEWPGARDQLV